MSWNKKNASPNKFFKINDEIECVITEIDKEKRRIAISHKLTKQPHMIVFRKISSKF